MNKTDAQSPVTELAPTSVRVLDKDAHRFTGGDDGWEWNGNEWLFVA